ncbi:hypothetical protein [Pseudomonas asplenii]|uniref:hypothetical protein n=1 Tax=Pseudomonas asplenii TaxID=53407 RepID=UPI00035E0F11|nr:hypothetical protein [Pseudomonas fuscovaginae]
MHLKNEAARLITIKHKANGELISYQILPGENPSVEVPDELAKIDFVKALLDIGDLRRVGADELNDDESEEGGDDIEVLRAEAEALGIKVDKRWKEAKLREEIAKVSA